MSQNFDQAFVELLGHEGIEVVELADVDLDFAVEEAFRQGASRAEPEATRTDPASPQDLAALELFQGVGEPDLAASAARCQLLHAVAGHVLFAPGRLNTKIFFVLEGQVRLYAHVANREGRLAAGLFAEGRVALAATLLTPASDRSLLLALPALAALAAFALPTFSRSASALIDWFTLLFFSGCALVIWVVWVAMQTGVPAKPAANVAKLAPGFEPAFGLTAFVAALAATIAWAWLVRWRTRRHRLVIWKSVVLPAGGAALCWLLLMTLWLPVLDYARSYRTVVAGVMQHVDRPGCVAAFGLSRAQIAALRFHGNLEVRPAGSDAGCPWLLVALQAAAAAPVALDMRGWELAARVRRPVDATEDLLLYRKAARR